MRGLARTLKGRRRQAGCRACVRAGRLARRRVWRRRQVMMAVLVAVPVAAAAGRENQRMFESECVLERERCIDK